jgi:hypothetical protein
MKTPTSQRGSNNRGRSSLNNEQSTQNRSGTLQPDAAGSALAKPISALGAQDVLALQRSVGNRATIGYMRSGEMSQPQTAISRTGPRIQRSLGKTQESSHAVHKPSGKRFEILAYDNVMQGETKLRRYYLQESEDSESFSVLEDNDDYDWITVTPEESEESDDGDLSDFWLEQKNINNNEESSDEKKILPLMMRPVVKLYMEQGCAGNLGRVQLFSGQFSSCSPVIIFNEETKIGGLYHYAGGKMDEEKSADLIQMLKFIKPTVVHVLQGEDSSEGNLKRVELDENELEDAPERLIPNWFHIKKLCHQNGCNNLVIDKANTWNAVTVTLGAEDSGLSISKGYPDVEFDLGNVKKSSLPEEFQHFGKKEIDTKMWN